MRKIYKKAYISNSYYEVLFSIDTKFLRLIVVYITKNILTILVNMGFKSSIKTRITLITYIESYDSNKLMSVALTKEIPFNELFNSSYSELEMSTPLKVYSSYPTSG